MRQTFVEAQKFYKEEKQREQALPITSEELKRLPSHLGPFPVRKSRGTNERKRAMAMRGKVTQTWTYIGAINLWICRRGSTTRRTKASDVAPTAAEILNSLCAIGEHLEEPQTKSVIYGGEQ